MSGCWNTRTRRLAAAIVLVLLGAVAEARGQSASMYGDPASRPPLTTDRVSWTYQAPLEPKVYKLHDFVTVMVDEKAQVVSEGEMDRRKKADGMMVLKDWIKLEGLSLKPAEMASGEPSVSGEVNGKFRADGELETREAMKLEIACEVVDIRPNGTLVLEGHESTQINDEQWDVSLGGTVRPDDILPDNTVLSRNIFGLRITKREMGAVRDSYRRGWLLRVFDKYQPF